MQDNGIMWDGIESLEQKRKAKITRKKHVIKFTLTMEFVILEEKNYPEIVFIADNQR